MQVQSGTQTSPLVSAKVGQQEENLVRYGRYHSYGSLVCQIKMRLFSTILDTDHIRQLLSQIQITQTSTLLDTDDRHLLYQIQTTQFSGMRPVLPLCVAWSQPGSTDGYTGDTNTQLVVIEGLSTSYSMSLMTAHGNLYRFPRIRCQGIDTR